MQTIRDLLGERSSGALERSRAGESKPGYATCEPAITGWAAMMAGIVSGSVMGIFFHREDWLGGYSSYRRRMVRLGHIAFFGMGAINLLMSASTRSMDRERWVVLSPIAARSLLVATLAMPLTCFLTAWRPSFRHFFPVPVAAAALAVAAMFQKEVRR